MMKKSENNTGTVLHWHKYASLPHDSTLHQQGPCIISSDSITRDRCNRVHTQDRTASCRPSHQHQLHQPISHQEIAWIQPQQLLQLRRRSYIIPTCPQFPATHMGVINCELPTHTANHFHASRGLLTPPPKYETIQHKCRWRADVTPSTSPRTSSDKLNHANVPTRAQ